MKLVISHALRTMILVVRFDVLTVDDDVLGCNALWTQANQYQCFSETVISAYKSMWCHNPEEQHQYCWCLPLLFSIAHLVLLASFSKSKCIFSGVHNVVCLKVYLCSLRL